MADTDSPYPSSFFLAISRCLQVSPQQFFLCGNSLFFLHRVSAHSYTEPWAFPGLFSFVDSCLIVFFRRITAGISYSTILLTSFSRTANLPLNAEEPLFHYSWVASSTPLYWFPVGFINISSLFYLSFFLNCSANLPKNNYCFSTLSGSRDIASSLDHSSGHKIQAWPIIMFLMGWQKWANQNASQGLIWILGRRALSFF